MSLRIKVTKREDIKIGYWGTYCCHKDLEEIKTESDIDGLIDFKDGDFEEIEMWETKLAALADIQYDFISSRTVSSNFKGDIIELQGMILEELK